MKKFVFTMTMAVVAAIGIQPIMAGPMQDVEIKKVPAKHTKANSGPQMYREYCAACHGMNGTGDGPAVPALKATPSDLTALSAKNGGKFPGMDVEAILRGNKELAAHGSAEMPTWGPIFRSLDANASSALMELRVRNLTDYLKSIQK